MSPPADGVEGGSSFRLIVLVGFMGSGKTSVGRRVARRLGWRFVDSDDEVEARAGSSVEAIFRERGEAGFRELEAQAMEDLLRGRHRVVATGGGWPAAGPGRLRDLPADVLTVWLRVPAPVAVERVAREVRSRPLLAVDDPVDRARRLLDRRLPAYRCARLHLDTANASVEALAAAIVERIAAVRDVPG